MGKPRDNPPRTAQVLRELIAEYRAEGVDVISLIDLELAINKLEANKWTAGDSVPSTPVGTERYPGEPTGRSGLDRHH